MSEKKYYLTKKGLEKIKKQYETLKEIRAAKTKGETPQILESEDLNPEYLSFQEGLDLLEKKMTELEEILKNTEIIKLPPRKKRDTIQLGATVSVEFDGEIDNFKIVGTKEADPTESKISNESPIGKSLMGKKVGETVVVKTQLVNHSCKILKIEYKKS